MIEKTPSKNFHLLMAEINPTPKPAKNRPATNIGMSVAAACKITPKLNIIEVDAMRPQRRPMASATGAAVRAPKNVPADRIETIMADWDAVMSRLPAGLRNPVENSSCQYGIARMPPIVPVSYLSFMPVSFVLILNQDAEA